MRKLINCKCGYNYDAVLKTCPKCGQAHSIFKAERSCNTDESTRYGKNIIDSFNVEEDLVFWPVDGSNNYWVTIIHPEISALCPVSGYPDSGKVTVEFKPLQNTVELKAFKLWINSYRNTNISHEDLANEIYNILKKGLKPQELYVKLEMMPRGNVTTIVEVGNSFNTCVKLGKES
jgi:7-cyano-7-deazaguanine reductase